MARAVRDAVPGHPHSVMRRRGGITVRLHTFQAGEPSQKTWSENLRNRVASLFLLSTALLFPLRACAEIPTALASMDMDSDDIGLQLIECIVSGGDAEAADALCTITSQDQFVYASFAKLLDRLPECVGSLDRNLLADEKRQPRCLRRIRATDYACLTTRKSLVLARLADYVRESPDSPMRIHSQELLLNAFWSTLITSVPPEAAADSELVRFAVRCVLYDHPITPEHGLVE